MTPRKMYEKYELKTDASSIKDRIMDTESYYWITTCKALCTESGKAAVAVSEVVKLSDELRNADLLLLYELAKKGESLVKVTEDIAIIIGAAINDLCNENQFAIAKELEDKLDLFTKIIAEAAGETK